MGRPIDLDPYVGSFLAFLVFTAALFAALTDWTIILILPVALALAPLVITRLALTVVWVLIPALLVGVLCVALARWVLGRRWAGFVSGLLYPSVFFAGALAAAEGAAYSAMQLDAWRQGFDITRRQTVFESTRLNLKDRNWGHARAWDGDQAYYWSYSRMRFLPRH